MKIKIKWVRDSISYFLGILSYCQWTGNLTEKINALNQSNVLSLFKSTMSFTECVWLGFHHFPRGDSNAHTTITETESDWTELLLLNCLNHYDLLRKILLLQRNAFSIIFHVLHDCVYQCCWCFSFSLSIKRFYSTNFKHDRNDFVCDAADLVLATQWRQECEKEAHKTTWYTTIRKQHNKSNQKWLLLFSSLFRLICFVCVPALPK